MFDISKLYCPVCKKGKVIYIPRKKEPILTIGNCGVNSMKSNDYRFKCTHCDKKWSEYKVTLDKDNNVAMFKLID